MSITNSIGYIGGSALPQQEGVVGTIELGGHSVTITNLAGLTQVQRTPASDADRLIDLNTVPGTSYWIPNDNALTLYLVDPAEVPAGTLVRGVVPQNYDMTLDCKTSGPGYGDINGAFVHPVDGTSVDELTFFNGAIVTAVCDGTQWHFHLQTCPIDVALIP
jgi:hypothetical protein